MARGRGRGMTKYFGVLYYTTQCNLKLWHRQKRPTLYVILTHLKWSHPKTFFLGLSRAGNSLIWFPSKSLIFCPKRSKWAIRSKKWAIHSFAHFWWAKWAIRSHRSFPLSHLSKSLMVSHFWWAKWAIRSHRSFDLSEMSDSLTSLTKKEVMSQNEWFAHFFGNFFLKP